jgi:hypothetical protein
METKAYLDRQVEAKKERKEQEKHNDQRLGVKVIADVKAFEETKRENKVN